MRSLLAHRSVPRFLSPHEERAPRATSDGEHSVMVYNPGMTVTWGRETMMHMIQLAAGALALVGGLLAAEASAAELKVLSAGAMRAVLQELGPAFESTSGHKLKIEYATAGVIEQKIAADDE